jgi:uncharacterized Zn finger protein
MTAKPICEICDDTGIDDRFSNYRACNYCRTGQVLKLNFKRLRLSELQAEVINFQREITELENEIQLIEEA